MTEAISRDSGEDVLSSIRRLVAVDSPAQIKAQEAVTVTPPDQAPEPAKSALHEKLLLTPSLRVNEPDETDQSNSNEEVNFTAADTDIPSLTSQISRASLAPVIEAEFAAEEIGPMAEQTQQEAQVQFDNSAYTQSVEDRALEATLARLQAVLAGNVRASGGDMPGDGQEPLEELIDEGMLYQLVAHIVRQELQGELGEKITRNIRKLVRAEVAREIQLRQL